MLYSCMEVKYELNDMNLMCKKVYYPVATISNALDVFLVSVSVT